MNKENNEEIVIARLIANTLRKKRPNNLMAIANDIRWLKNDLGSLRAVSKIIGISTDMLGQFLSVEDLCPQVQQLVKKRQIDLINIVRYIRGFTPQEQQVIAKEVIAGRLSATDIRVLAPLKTNHPKLTIDKLISRIKKARNIREYIAYFNIPKEFTYAAGIKNRFEKIIGKNEIISFDVKNLVGTIKLTFIGQKRVKESAKEHNLSLREFVDLIVLNKIKIT